MRRIAAGVFCTAFVTLLFELTLIRVFDVLWYPNMAHMVITLAIFAFGLAGVVSTLMPPGDEDSARRHLVFYAAALSVSTLIQIPLLDSFNFDYKLIGVDTFKALLPLTVIYIGIAIPFFITGMVLTIVFTVYASRIQRLYFWDLVGAALGSVILIPLLPKYGGPGLMVLSGGLALFASVLFSRSRIWQVTGTAAAAVISVYPLAVDGYLDIDPHMDKRGFATLRHQIEVTWWDPISRIDVVDYRKGFKWLAYDGGTQTSYFYKFDGDYEALRDVIPELSEKHFWGRYVLASHYLKEGTDQEVLVIGSAGGQETKAALLYGASHVDGIELVGAVVGMGKQRYDEYIGGVFNDPRVNNQRGEGRSYLRSTDKKYDIIQILSNHTSSSIAAGSGAMKTNYLQTAEAYQEYFSRLKEDGILHINHHIYPKMITTAALAWKQMGFENFRDHVIVFEGLTLPTLLIKMVPWTEDEVKRIGRFLGGMKMVENPFEPEESFLSDDFYSGDFPDELAKKSAFRVEPSTDNRPYFNHLRKKIGYLEEDADNYLNFSTVHILNSQMQGRIPVDILNFIVTGGAALVLAAVFLFVPMAFSKAGRSGWSRKGSFLTYFACLGAGFIIFELIFIQIFMKLVGYPLYTYSLVVFTFLFAAGLGSFASEKLDISSPRRWWWPYLGIILYCVAFLPTYQELFNVALTAEIAVRMAIAFVVIFPLAFFLGMPFPLGILSVKDRPRGTVAWAWAINGFFTVVGGLASVLISLYIGFRETVLVALACYILAMFMYQRMESGKPAGA